MAYSSVHKFLPNVNTHDVDIEHSFLNIVGVPSNYIDGKYLRSTVSGTVWDSISEYAISEVFYTSDDLSSSTSNTELTKKVRLNIENTTSSGNYRIGWCYEWAYSSSSSEFVCRVQLDDVVDLSYIKARPAPSDIDCFRSSSGFCYTTLSSGNHYIDIDWCSSSYGKYAVIRKARIDAWRLV